MRALRPLRAIERRVIAPTPIRLRARPDFVIIGAMKAATTSLYEWLAEHPDVVPASRKELHFFSARWSRGVGYYWLDFPSRARMAVATATHRRRVVTGESTPIYLVHPLVPERMHSVLPDVKLVAVLRDPIDRAISHYRHAVSRGLEELSFEEAIAAEPERLAIEFERLERGEAPSRVFGDVSYVTRGMYAEQVHRWLDWYPREQMLFVRFEDLVTRPSVVGAEVLEFIDVDPARAPALSFPTRNVGTGDADIGSATIERLRATFEEPNAQLADEFGIRFDSANHSA